MKVQGEQGQGGEGGGEGGGGGESLDGIFGASAIEDPGAAPADEPGLDPDPAAAQDEPGAQAKDGEQQPDVEGTEGEDQKADDENPDNPDDAADDKGFFNGRYKTREEFEKAHEESSREGLRLYRENKAIRDQIAELQEKLAEKDAEIAEARKAPAFQALSADQEAKLKQEDPAKYAEYLIAKTRHEDKEAARKESEKKAREDAKAERERVGKKIVATIREMESDPKKFPDFKALKTDGALTGHEWTPKVLYLCALGVKHYRGLMAGRKATAEGREKAKATAAAGARASGVTGKTRTDIPKGQGGERSDEDEVNAILKAAPKSVFR
jgi:hypothetical protein